MLVNIFCLSVNYRLSCIGIQEQIMIKKEIFDNIKSKFILGKQVRGSTKYNKLVTLNPGEKGYSLASRYETAFNKKETTNHGIDSMDLRVVGNSHERPTGESDDDYGEESDKLPSKKNPSLKSKYSMFFLLSITYSFFKSKSDQKNL